MPSRRLPLLLATIGATALAAGVACTEDALPALGGSAGADAGEPFAELVENGFESSDPGGFREGRLSVPPLDAAASPSAPPSGGDEAARVVEEADVVKVEGTLAYALSRYGGLSIIDLAAPDRPTLLGRARTDGVPFEMNVRGGRAYVTFNGQSRVARDPATNEPRVVTSSAIVALDVSDPANVRELETFDVPGQIVDSRVVGDALYLVSYEQACWRCAETPSTVVTSFDVSGARPVAQVDRLTFTSPVEGYAGWRRSVAATDRRLYVAGPAWSWGPGEPEPRSVVQIVDVSDPSGRLVKGADVPVAGQIHARWQMDEHEGVLRVVSQYGNGLRRGDGTVDPDVETFRVTSSQDVTPLGATKLVLPKPETLRSVRFDGSRGYAITAERTDPLFTIDLSDPAAPRQVGELEMPGWVFHLEPRGDRLVGFGFEDTAPRSRLAVSLFDVANLAQPRLLSRVPVGTGPGGVAEDQDRVHKSVQLLDARGLVLVPFASGGAWDGARCAPGTGGIQLIDWTRDTLVARGVAPQRDMTRRAFFAGDRLVAVSDRALATFDVTSRDAPLQKAEVALSTPAQRIVEVPGHVVAVTGDAYGTGAELSVIPNASPSAVAGANAVGTLALPALVGPSAVNCGAPAPGTPGPWAAARFFVDGATVHVVVPHTERFEGAASGNWSERRSLAVFAVDVTDPSAPRLLGHATLRGAARAATWGNAVGTEIAQRIDDLVRAGDDVVRVGTKVAYLEVGRELVGWEESTPWKVYPLATRRRLHVVDFADPTAPKVHPPLDLGESLGAAPLQAFGTTVLTTRWLAAPSGRDRVRFYADRVDLAGPTPRRLASVNVPGSLLAVDAQASRLATVDYEAIRNTVPSADACGEQAGVLLAYDAVRSSCFGRKRTFKLVDLDGTRVTSRQELPPPSQRIGAVTLAEGRVHVFHPRRYGPSYVPVPGGPTKQDVLEEPGLWSFGGIREGTLALAGQAVGVEAAPLAVRGAKVVAWDAEGLAVLVVDGATPRRLGELPRARYGYTDVVLGEHGVIVARGASGLQAFPH